eukprot:5935664-Prymnesium_polylepis.1
MLSSFVTKPLEPPSKRFQNASPLCTQEYLCSRQPPAPWPLRSKMDEEVNQVVDGIVGEFQTYEDYLDSQISATDLYYLEDEDLARQCALSPFSPRCDPRRVGRVVSLGARAVSPTARTHRAFGARAG